MAGYRAPKLADGSVAAGKTKADFAQSLLRGGSRQIPRVGEVGGLVLPAIPILTVFQGSSGTSLTLQSAAVVATSSDLVYLELVYEFFSNTASGTHTGFLINTVAQWKIAAFFAGAATSPTDGLPRPLARGTNGVLWFQNNVIANHIICAGITLVKT